MQQEVSFYEIIFVDIYLILSGIVKHFSLNSSYASSSQKLSNDNSADLYFNISVPLLDQATLTASSSFVR